MDDIVNECKARREAISRQLRALTSQRRAERHRLQQVAKYNACEWTVPPQVMRAALVIYEQCGWNAEPSIQFIMRVGRANKMPSITDVEAIVLLEEAFLVNDLKELMYAADVHVECKWMLEAKRVISEWHIVQWGSNLNMHQGVAPSTASILEKAQAAGHVLPKTVFARTRNGRPGSTARMWASRFRKRWGAAIGKVKQNEHIPLDVLRAKVGVVISHAIIPFSVMCPYLCPYSGLVQRCIHVWAHQHKHMLASGDGGNVIVGSRYVVAWLARVARACLVLNCADTVVFWIVWVCKQYL